MTVYQQAHGLIDMLSEESAEVVVQVMLRMLPYERRPVQSSEPARQVPVQNQTQEERQIQELLQKQGLLKKPEQAQNQTQERQIQERQMQELLQKQGLLSNQTQRQGQNVIQPMSDDVSMEVDAFNEEMAGFFQSDSGIRL